MSSPNTNNHQLSQQTTTQTSTPLTKGHVDSNSQHVVPATTSTANDGPISTSSVGDSMSRSDFNEMSLNNQSSIPMRNIPANASFKEQKKSYNLRKKYFTKNIQSAIESTQEVHSGWLKARTTFKSWTKVWCQLKPGYLILYTSQEAQKSHRFGVVLLSVCQLMRRPTKKEGFCFKLINPFGCSVWAVSSTRAFVFPHSSLTVRASDEIVGKLWVDALHRCHLSANLEGYQSIIEDSLLLGSGRASTPCNRSETSDSGDDGASSTRQLESILGRQSNSDSSSLRSSSISNKGTQNRSNGTSKREPLFEGNAAAAAAAPPSGKRFDPYASDSTMTNSVFKYNDFTDRKTTLENETSQVVKQNDDFGHSKNNHNYNVLNNNNHNHVSNRNILDHANGQPTSRNQVLNVEPSANSSTAKMVAKLSRYNWRELQLESVIYTPDDGAEELGSAGVQSEEVHESNKNFLWHIIKQLRPGMDLSKVTLPTFILEPRSFLEKLADYYYHCDILSDAVLIDDPVVRLVNIVKWYLSGFYKKPKGPKKPYNPILGERFRCFWDHPKTQSRTFFVAEQVSHHPPVSAFHVSNRKDGYTITCSPLSRSKFGGNSVSAILDGKAKLHLIRRNETYTLTMPYAQCRGILLGSLCLELGGKVEIECAETDCRCELDFKLAPVWASSTSYNSLTGKIFLANKVTHTLDGHWDKRISIVDKRTDEKSILWEVNDSVRSSRLKRYTVDFKDQEERESVKLWSKVTDALNNGDQVVATTEKTRLEDMQRQEARERKETFAPQNFELKPGSGSEWLYKWQDSRVWDDRQDIMQFEENFKIKTLVLNQSNLRSAQHSSDPIVNRFNTTVDMPVTKLNKLRDQILEGSSGREVESEAGTSDQNEQMGTSNMNSDSVVSMQSMMDAKNQLIEQAIRQMTEKSKKLEEDIANLKRGKKTVALVMTAIIVILISASFSYFSY